jgi:predicted PurR-regulated permease PerM
MILTILDRSSNLQQPFLFNNTKNTTSRLTIYDKTNIRALIKKYLIYFIIYLIYTIILILLTYYLIPKFQQQTKALPIDNKRIYNRGKTTTKHSQT